MAVKRSIPDQAKEQSLRLIANNLAAQFAAHQKICYDCKPGDNLPERACSEGWRLAKESLRARHVLAVFTGDPAINADNGQVALW